MGRQDRRADATERRLDVWGIAALFALVGWVLVVAVAVGGRPLPVIALLLATGGVLFGAREVTRRHGTAVPATVAGGIALLALLSGTNAVGNTRSPLGYANASAALYVVGVAAAGMVVLRTPVPRIRTTFIGVGALLALLPLVAGALAGVGGALLVLATVVALETEPRLVPRRLFPAALAIVGVVLVSTATLGIVHRGGDGLQGGPLTERRMVLWSDAVTLIGRAPFFGVGPGRFAQASPTARLDADARWAHHEILEFGAENGLIGLVLLVGLLVWCLVWLEASSGRRGAVLATALLVAATSHACIDYVWQQSPLVPITLAAVLGAGATRPGGWRAGR